MSQVNRFDLKNYYRGSAGFMTFMNGIFMLAVCAIGFFVAENFTDIANSSADSDNGIVSLYYVVVFFGLCLSILNVCFGISGMRGVNDGNFKTQRTSAVLTAVLMVLYCFSAMVTFTDEQYDVKDIADMTYILIGVGIAVAAVIYAVFVFISTNRALKYCDNDNDKEKHNGKKKAKKGKLVDRNEALADVPDGITGELLERRTLTVMFSGYGLISAAIWLMYWYFERQVKKYEGLFATDCGADPLIFMTLKVLGILGILYMVVCMYMNFKSKKTAQALNAVNIQCIIYNTVVMIMALVFCIFTGGRNYVLSGYPAHEYYVFEYVLVVFAGCIGWTMYNRIRKQKQAV